MMGFILTKKEAEDMEKSIKDNFAKQGLPFFWSPGFYEIDSGASAGNYFMPLTNEMFNTNLCRGMKFGDFADSQKAIVELRKKVIERDFQISDLKSNKREA